MINRQRERTIKNADSRIEILHDLIVEGEDAEAVYKYAFKLRKEADENMLKAALAYGDIENQRSDYRAICRLCEMLEFAARTGKQKAKVLAEIKS